jgi:hypothetical protein
MSVFIARLEMSAACMLSTSFRVCMRRRLEGGPNRLLTVSKRFANDSR